MHYKITTLVENAVYRRNLQAEHGLSLLIENNGYKILFDTGQSGSIYPQCDTFGYRDCGSGFPYPVTWT